MKWKLIRYRTRAEKTEENAALVRAVFEELKTQVPSGLRYMALRLQDGQFAHLVATEEGASPLSSLAAFQAFQAGVKERQLAPPTVEGVEILGEYCVLRD